MCEGISSVVSVFKSVWERSTAQNYCPVSFFSVVKKLFEELVNNRLVDHLEKCDIFPVENFLTFVPDRIAHVFNGSRVTCAAIRGKSKAFLIV